MDLDSKCVNTCTALNYDSVTDLLRERDLGQVQFAAVQRLAGGGAGGGGPRGCRGGRERVRARGPRRGGWGGLGRGRNRHLGEPGPHARPVLGHSSERFYR